METSDDLEQDAAWRALLPELAELIRGARAIVVLTGAGVSAESGLPTFRDAQTGLWARYRPEDLATRAAFQHDPQLVWDWYAWRRGLAEQALPNPGHLALAELERRAAQFTLVTQNVDGLHQLAGSQRVIELHGNIRRVKCFDDGQVVEQWQPAEGVPRCPRCGGLLRPDVVWFGELLPAAALERARDLTLECDLFLSIGTSAQVEPAASLPRLALGRGAPVAIVNPDQETGASRGLYRLGARAGLALPALVRAAWPEDHTRG